MSSTIKIEANSITPIKTYRTTKRQLTSNPHISKLKNFSQYLCKDIREVFNRCFQITLRHVIPQKERKADLQTYVYFFSKYRSIDKQKFKRTCFETPKQTVNIARLKFFLLYDRYPSALDNKKNPNECYKVLFDEFIGQKVEQSKFIELSMQMKMFLLKPETRDLLFDMIKNKSKGPQFGELYLSYTKTFLEYLQNGEIPNRIKIKPVEVKQE